MDPISEITITVAGVAFLLKIIFDFLKQYRGNGSTTNENGKINWHAVVKKIDEMHHWHDKEDEDGVKVWYVRTSLERAIDRLNENIGQQTKVLEGLVRAMTLHEKHQEDAFNKIQDKMGSN